MLIVLDAAANICSLPDLPATRRPPPASAYSSSPSFKDLAQIRTRYHDAALTVVNNHIAKVVLSGVADRETLDSR